MVHSTAPSIRELVIGAWILCGMGISHHVLWITFWSLVTSVQWVAVIHLVVDVNRRRRNAHSGREILSEYEPSAECWFVTAAEALHR